ncbi:undecaprenyl-phosphate alpha-N-acetylglucosaminyl 1-phosphate transferase [Compostibacillus humi]|uniref:Undecaprenyl-phosphate alpha-N-acetylglucosaminyl 1-phosphate transferase n=1 Tax=Compostibacillus humi TaxID=1245525 RepID=A0A8J3EJ31_9BACI|nr:MraY family glycosyltransferase [Compostibacillus humi]GGH70892.1 undecaprenyl-phosphate alpha-N-acetylglucosaminyl 1-phosphate transferase [Compostibacillus humi]
MIFWKELLIGFFVAFISALLLTYPIKSLAVRIGAMDKPNKRKIHQKAMPRLGGLAIFFGTLAGMLYLEPEHEHLLEIFLGALVIIITGVLDDKYTLKPLQKLVGQFVATSFLISSGLIIDRITLPIIGVVDLGFLSVLITVIWVIGITNAINLIDGLDGLATGVTSIALISIFIMSILDQQFIVTLLSIGLLGANAGFLFHNFHPAKIYMGDTGSNFLGYMVAVISMLGLFKNLTFFSFIVPIIVLAVPIFDTLLAIYQRAKSNENIMQADRRHLHYQLMDKGFSHRQTILIIYGFSAVFGALAIIFANASLTVLFAIIIITVVLLHIFAILAGVTTVK